MQSIAHTAVSLVLLSATSINLPIFGTNSSAKPAVVVASAASNHKPVAKSTSKPVTLALVMVTVQPGDTLTSIADSNGTTYQRLFNANESLNDPNIIQPGQQLRIPHSDEVLTDRPLPVNVAASTPIAKTASYATQSASSVTFSATSPVIGNDAKAYIYTRESGNNPNATNPAGCYGLGQDCNGVVRAQCGADYACQDVFFTNYALNRYGSWDAALVFWQANGWW